MIIVCGRYEGIDDRVRTGLAAREISIGDYVLSGGEIPAMVLIDAVARLVPGIVGDPESLAQDSFSDRPPGWPQFTRPADYRGLMVPDVLLSGDHARIKQWRRRQAAERIFRPYQGVRKDMNVIEQLEKEQQKDKVPALRAGDTVKVHAKVVEGTRERIQVFEGIVLRVTGGGLRQNFTVRRVTHGVGVERTFMIHSPRIDKIEVLRHGDVRQGRLYYLRGKVGKEARIRERRQLPRRAEAEAEERKRKRVRGVAPC